MGYSGVGLGGSGYWEFSIDHINATAIHFPIRLQIPPEDNLKGVIAEN